MNFAESSSSDRYAVSLKSFAIDFAALLVFFFLLWFLVDVGVDYAIDRYYGVQLLDSEKVINYAIKDLIIGSILALIMTSVKHFYYKKSIFPTRIK